MSPLTGLSQGKTALVLAGGGLTGAVYEIGALRAIDDMLVNRSVNDLDIYVGTSAGSLVASMLANGISPEMMLKVLDGSQEGIPPLQRKHIFNTNLRSWLDWGSRLPGKLLSTWATYLSHLNEMTFFDLLWSLSEALPPGLYSSLGLEKFIAEVLDRPEFTNDFNKLDRELYIIATDLDNGRRAIFGPGSNDETPISLAVAASSALPVVYRPVRIGDREYVDGGLRGTASLDLAVERGATLVVCINPMVPFEYKGGGSRGHLPENLSDRGIRLIADQTLRIAGHAGLQYHVKQLRRRHPEVDIILIEPKPDDYQMFLDNIMRYSARLVVARHGFESVTLDMAQDYQAYKDTLARHGIQVTRRLVIEELAEIAQSEHDPAVIQRILESRPATCAGQQPNKPFCRLNRALDDLDSLLAGLS